MELTLQPHPDAPELPVQRGASGGELSRVMLAIEVALAGTDPVPTMIFDEVDAGVGGRAAVEIGRRLARLARSHQVIVVTHLAQVASFADRHLVVDKTAGQDGGMTHSDIRTVTGEALLVELARMLAGDDTPVARRHAAELLAAARESAEAVDRPTHGESWQAAEGGRRRGCGQTSRDGSRWPSSRQPPPRHRPGRSHSEPSGPASASPNRSRPGAWRNAANRNPDGSIRTHEDGSNPLR